jgi:hypothetical protein
MAELDERIEPEFFEAALDPWFFDIEPSLRAQLI